MRNHKAFSLAEVLVALVVFSIAATGGAAALGLASRAQRQAIARREALSAIEMHLALLSAAPCDSVSSAPVVVNGIPISTTIAPTDSLVSITVSASHGGTRSLLRTEITCE